MLTIKDIMDRIDTTSDEAELRGYQTKPLAVVCSSFEEVVLLDADALCFVDPQYLFLAQGYENSGMLLFKDYVDCMSFISRDFIETIGIGVDTYCDYTKTNRLARYDTQEYWARRALREKLRRTERTNSLSQAKKIEEPKPPGEKPGGFFLMI